MSRRLFLDERRNSIESLDGIVGERYRRMVLNTVLETAYLYKGEASTYYFKNHISGSRGTFDFTEDVGGLLAGRSEPLRVLDLGAGACRPLIEVKKRYGDDVEAVGATGHDIWSDDCPGSEAYEVPSEHGIDLRIGNIDHWSGVVKLDEVFDLIVSHYCASWLVDPLGALERSLAQLAPGGQLFVEPTGLETSGDATCKIVDALQGHGYNIGAGWDIRRNTIYSLRNFLHIVKDSDEIGEPIFGGLDYYDGDLSYRILLRNPSYQGYASIGYQGMSET